MIKSVSVIMLNYNSGEEIFESIQSVLNQDYQDIELIISDDASCSFPSAEIRRLLSKKKTSYFKYKIFEHKKNVGTVKNINSAVKKSSGDIIINLSAGDIFYDKDIVRKIVSEFNNTACEFLFTRRVLYKDNVNNLIGFMPSDYDLHKIKKFHNSTDEYIALCTSDFHNLASGCVFACKRELLQRYNYYDERYRLWEDGPFFSTLMQDGIRMHCNFDIISIYYRAGGVSTGRLSPMMCKDIDVFLSDALQKKNIFQGFNKRKLEYAYLKKVKIYNDKHTLFFYRLRYMDVMIYRFFQYLDERRFYLLRKNKKIKEDL